MEPVGHIAVQPWMQAPETSAVLDALAAGGATARFVGGCVRDTVLNRPVTDIDIAIDSAPDANLKWLGDAGIHTIPTGVQHGTIIAVANKRHFEITSLRVDVETFGRHARVAFTDNWTEDAERRDFTMNAMFADRDGTLYDPTGGLADARAGRVRFVGDARRRIEEDYLRILRFFRFHAWYGVGEPDDAALAASRDLAAGLDRLSGERIRNEFLRLLAAPDPLPCLQAMADAGVMPHVLLDGADLAALTRLLSVEETGDRLLRLAAVMQGDAATGQRLARRFHLSGKERDRLLLLLSPPVKPVEGDDQTALTRKAYDIGAEALSDLALLLGDADLADRARQVAVPRFPLQGRDAMALGMPAGPAVGRLLRDMEAAWKDGGFATSEAELRRDLAARVKAAGRVN